MQTPLTLRRWERAEYDRLVDLGVFQGEAIELIGGQLVVAEPQGSYHAGAITKVDYALRAILPHGWIVRLQAPVSLDDESEPEPDVVVVPGHPGDYLASHPAHPALAVELAQSSLDFDRARKGSLYARAAVPDYWIVNLVDGVVEVYRDPEPDASAAFGWRYRSVTRLAPPAPSRRSRSAASASRWPTSCRSVAASAVADYELFLSRNFKDAHLGSVARALERTGARGVSVAPPSK